MVPSGLLGFSLMLVYVMASETPGPNGTKRFEVNEYEESVVRTFKIPANHALIWKIKSLDMAWPLQPHCQFADSLMGHSVGTWEGAWSYLPFAGVKKNFTHIIEPWSEIYEFHVRFDINRKNGQRLDSEINLTPSTRHLEDPEPEPGCGIRPSEGIDSPHDPWHVFIRWQTPDELSGFCSGTLITPTLVLTAAHCLRSCTFRDVKDLSVHLGNGLLERGVREFTIHEKYYQKGGEDEFDLAILVLDEPVPISSKINVVCLPQNMRCKTFEDAQLHLTVGEPLSSLRRRVALKGFDYLECDSMMRWSLCAVASSESQEIPRWEAGGSMTWKYGDRHYLAGITSYQNTWRYRAKGGLIHGSRITTFLPWINTVVDWFETDREKKSASLEEEFPTREEMCPTEN